jgi:DNA-binding NtrC family response regulator
MALARLPTWKPENAKNITEHMSKILIVEPYRILQQAMTLAFFPQHEVQVTETLPASSAGAVKGYDVIVIDAAALREKKGLDAHNERAIQNWRVPMIWLEGEGLSSAASRKQFVVIQTPIDREQLLAALAQCLGRKKGNGAQKEANGAGKAAARERKAARAADEQGAKIIELVDVVEEAPRQEKAAGQRTTKK